MYTIAAFIHEIYEKVIMWGLHRIYSTVIALAMKTDIKKIKQNL